MRGSREGPLPQDQPVDARELSRYIAEMCSDLARMASSARLLMLTYLLSMARQEAERIARTSSTGDTPSAPELR